ncbi:hypothetical protein Q8F55_004645 [Vanrija albida]|uniref:CCHC-type domain-containing protein n=1 Tax=Vanrija albida TaxID=181172 RepID=A0ABR3Q8G3_9TREE
MRDKHPTRRRSPSTPIDFTADDDETTRDEHPGRGRSPSTPIDITADDEDASTADDEGDGGSQGVVRRQSSPAEVVKRRPRPESSPAEVVKPRHRESSPAEVVKKRKVPAGAKKKQRSRLSSSEGESEGTEMVKKRKAAGAGGIKGKKRHSRLSSSESESEGEGDGTESVYNLYAGEDYSFTPAPKHKPKPKRRGIGSPSSSDSDSDDTLRSRSGSPKSRPQSRKRRRSDTDSDTESSTSESDDSSEGGDSDEEHNHPAYNDHYDLPKTFPWSCPDHAHFALIHARLRRPASAKRLDKWLRKNRHGDINMHEVQHLVFPHRHLRWLVRNHLPRTISGAYRPLLRRLRAFAVSLFRPIRHATRMSKACRLRTALWALGDDLPLHQPACERCQQTGLPCLDVREPRCWDCKLHGKHEKACSHIRAYRHDRRRVDAAEELESDLREYMLVDEPDRRRRRAAYGLVDDVSRLLDDPHDTNMKHAVLMRLNNHVLVQERNQDRRMVGSDLVGRVRQYLRAQPKVETSDEEDEDEGSGSGYDDEDDDEDEEEEEDGDDEEDEDDDEEEDYDDDNNNNDNDDE